MFNSGESFFLNCRYNLSTEELQQKMKQILEDNRHFIEGKKDE
tara:strand:- start:387 stop:515 length:129 start_codon:yes stop_codon:yes gene_type:complete